MAGSKRARRHRKQQKQNTHQHNASTFEAKCDGIKSLFSPYRPDDVAIALSVSDLWLPNTSSQVKHTFAFAVFASMSPNSFFASKTLDSYDDYKKFIEKLYDLLPNFGMLEDYVPELDWGEIRFLSRGKPFKVFYGGSVERITDFITAFDLVHTQIPAASIDMHVALLAQDHVIKRGDRYMLKPIIAGPNGTLVWGAASVGRSESVWLQSLSQGYMPADFNWPNVRRAVEETKDYLEKQLEVVTALVLERASPHVAGGIDFARRFPNEGFEDVGDFDGLAYFPDINRWLAVECKYNQPAFCLKDARRLRERIFGRPTKDKGQFEKIERRTAFLKINSERLRTLLGWPAPRADAAIAVDELYVSRDIYWWMRNPPYKVDATFVRVDALEGWLRDNQLLRQGP